MKDNNIKITKANKTGTNRTRLWVARRVADTLITPRETRCIGEHYKPHSTLTKGGGEGNDVAASLLWLKTSFRRVLQHQCGMRGEERVWARDGKQATRSSPVPRRTLKGTVVASWPSCQVAYAGRDLLLPGPLVFCESRLHADTALPRTALDQIGTGFGSDPNITVEGTFVLRVSPSSGHQLSPRGGGVCGMCWLEPCVR